MKKILCLSVFIFVGKFSFSEDAQDKFKNFRLGLKIAPSIYWDSPDDSKSFTSSGVKPKFSYGAIVEYKLNKTYSIATGFEVNYASFGINFMNKTYLISSIPDTFLIKSRIYNVTYLDIPLTFKMKTPEIGYMTYFGQFGLDLSFCAKGKSNDSGILYPSINESQETDVQVTDDLNLLKLALNIGGGMEYNLAGGTSLLIGANFHNGFTNILKSESVSLKNSSYKSLTQNTTLSYLSLNLGYLF